MPFSQTQQRHSIAYLTNVYFLSQIDMVLTDRFYYGQRNFLTNRHQGDVIRGTYSDWSPVTSGVPQGTILGPILYLIYINDMPDVVKWTIKLFADDTKIYRELTDPNDALTLQSVLDSLAIWATDWQVKFNPRKMRSNENNA